MAIRKPRNPDGNQPDDESIVLGKRFGERVGLICDARGIVGSDLDSQIGVERGTLWAIMRGSRGSKVSAVLVARVADALDVDMEWLFTGRASDRAFSRKGFMACGVAPTSSLWPKAVGRLAEAIVPSGPRPGPVARKTKPRR
jgi:transcriptional regulator with XRE-family HTH domain